MILLKEITRDNFDEVINLSVSDQQKNYIASNMYSLAQAKAQPECVPLAIYNDSNLVGFLMYCMDFDDKEYWIYRVMIDKKHQKMGYGRKAMECLLETLMKDTAHDKVYISFEPENLVAKKLYDELGFVADGRIVEGEIVYCLQYRNANIE